MLIALYIGMTIYTDGLENAFGGALAPIQPLQMRDSSGATGLTPAAQEGDAPAERERRVWITDAVREQVTSDLESGARRRGYE
jgi:hypothetical protein